jgi:hypothetical protein
VPTLSMLSSGRPALTPTAVESSVPVGKRGSGPDREAGM